LSFPAKTVLSVFPGDSGIWLLNHKRTANCRNLSVGCSRRRLIVGSLKLRYHLANDDTLVVTVELPKPITIKMIRHNEETKP